jgi:hypothetical protein
MELGSPFLVPTGVSWFEPLCLLRRLQVRIQKAGWGCSSLGIGGWVYPAIPQDTASPSLAYLKVVNCTK